MKKLLIIIGFLFIGLFANAVEYQFLATKFSLKSEATDKFPEWKSCEIPITIDFDRHRIVVNSAEKQIIDFANLEQLNVGSDATCFTALATDTNYQTIRIQIWYQSTQMVLRIFYSDVQYQYGIPKRSEGQYN